jgi:hypothetical protein
MASFWSDACSNAQKKSLHELLAASYGSSGATVSTQRRRNVAVFSARVRCCSARNASTGRSLRTA